MLEELGHGSTEIDKVDWFRDVVAKSRRDTLVLDIRHDVGGQGDDRDAREVSRLFPEPNLTTGLVAVFAWHMEITLGTHVSKFHTKISKQRHLRTRMRE
jgi:hypothetical protein